MSSDPLVLKPKRGWLPWIIAAIVLTTVPLVLVGMIPPYAKQMFMENVVQETPDEPAPGHPQPRTWDPQRVTVSWIGHATVLINFYGTTILTDPMFSRRMAPPEIFGTNYGIRRIMRLPLDFNELPPIDIVLLSHAHPDHWDLPTLRRFNSHTRVFIPRLTTDLIPARTFGEVRELDWGETTQVGELRIRAGRVDHWGQRDGIRADRVDRGYNGYLLSLRGRKIFFAGDSAYKSAPDGSRASWHAALSAFGPIDLCLLPIGAYVYSNNHMSPKEAWQLFNELQGRYLVPIHWRTFLLAPRMYEPISAPITWLREVAKDRVDRIVAADAGTVFVLPESP